MAREQLTSPGGISYRRTWRRPRTVLASVVGLLVLLGSFTACESNSADRNLVIRLVNQSRSENGLRPVKENLKLDLKADKWAQHLRDICDLEHSRLDDGAPNEWLKLGENVGYGGNIDQVHTAYLNSPGHRANILDPAYTQMGAAAVWGNCPDGSRRVFTVQVFMKS